MLYEFIATLAAGFGLAGVALVIAHLCKLTGKRAPKWLIPSFAALGIFGFQIHQEYHWYEQQAAQLPEGVTVVKTIDDSVWFRPWSYVKPQTVRFIAADNRQTRAHVDNDNVYLINLYLFERRMSVQQVPQVIDCNTPARADYLIPDSAPTVSLDDYVKTTTKWQPLSRDDALYTSICRTQI